MTQRISMAEMYDIAAAFITDKDTQVQVLTYQDLIEYTFTKHNLADYPYCLVISIERGAPQKCRPHLSKRDDGNYDVVTRDNKPGHVYLKRGTGVTGHTGNRVLVTAQTRKNVGRAFDKSQRDIVKAFTRFCSPSFFNVYDLANKRASGQLATKDNGRQLFSVIYRLNEKIR